jgi:secondary thiamine-phosphate synthase enzyme
LEQIKLNAKTRGFHLITDEIVQKVPELLNYKVGLVHIFITHTSASITLNENADPSVRVDMEMSANRIVPENVKYTHDDEGND